MSLPAQNLHDFVLKLMTDEAARSAFAADPTAALAEAGLSDVTPQDIQEVAPLVAEYAPDLGSLPVSAPDLGSLPSASDLGDVPASALDLGDLPVATPDVADVQAAAMNVADEATGVLASSDDHVNASGTASSDYVNATGTASGDGVGLAASVTTPTAPADAALDSLGAADATLGDYGLGTDSIPTSAADLTGRAGDLAGSLDSGVLGRTDLAAGTVASYVSHGGHLLADGVSSTSNSLGDHLTSAGEQAGAAVSEGGETLSQHIAQTSEAAAHASVPAVPAAGAAPAVAEAASHLPAHLPLHLDTDIPHLPVANPLPTVEHVAAPVSDLVSHSPLGDPTDVVDHAAPVSDLVSHSPLGDAAGVVDHAALPEVGDLGGDLPLGH